MSPRAKKILQSLIIWLCNRIRDRIRNQKWISFKNKYKEDLLTSKLYPKTWQTTCPRKRLLEKLREMETTSGTETTNFVETAWHPEVYLRAFPCDCREKMNRNEYTLLQDDEDLCLYDVFLKQWTTTCPIAGCTCRNVLPSTVYARADQPNMCINPKTKYRIMKPVDELKKRLRKELYPFSNEDYFEDYFTDNYVDCVDIRLKELLEHQKQLIRKVGSVKSEESQVCESSSTTDEKLLAKLTCKIKSHILQNWLDPCQDFDYQYFHDCRYDDECSMGFWNMDDEDDEEDTSQKSTKMIDFIRYRLAML